MVVSGKFLGLKKPVHEAPHDGDSENQLLLTPSFVSMNDGSTTGVPEPSYLCGFGDWAASLKII